MRTRTLQALQPQLHTRHTPTTMLTQPRHNHSHQHRHTSTNTNCSNRSTVCPILLLSKPVQLVVVAVAIHCPHSTIAVRMRAVQVPVTTADPPPAVVLMPLQGPPLPSQPPPSLRLYRLYPNTSRKLAIVAVVVTITRVTVTETTVATRPCDNLDSNSSF